MLSSPAFKTIPVTLLLWLAVAHSAAGAADRALKQAVSQNAALAPVAALPDEAFTRRSKISQVRLSPDGARLAWLESDAKDLALHLLDIKDGSRRKLLTVSGRNELHWSTDSGAIFIDSGSALAAVSIADGNSSKIAAFDRKLEQQFVSMDQTSARHALVESYDRAARTYRLGRVAADGSTAVVYEGEKLAGFLLDGAGKLSFARKVDKDFNGIVYRMQDGTQHEVRRCPRLRACQLVAASPDGRHLTMVVNHNADRKALVRIDTRTGKEQLLHTDPLGVSDLREALVPAGAREPLFALYDMPARRNLGLSPSAIRASGQIARRFPDSNITIGASAAATRWLLTERSARLQQERYWLYDVASGRFDPILEQERAAAQPLAESELARKIALTYRGSDGAALHGYLSLPPGKPAASLPMVTMIHGGPWGKFDNDYSPFVQLLVNRGYAVFQPNFRASTGYGHKYTTAPRSDFGNGRVQADIIDGVRYLLANGVGDKDRLAVMGDSFGGYGTLLALTHTPEMFRFGMAMVPPTDFVRVMQAAASGPAMGDEPPFSVTLSEMGIDLADTAAMQKIAAAAPAANAGKVMRPLLILAGGKDQMVAPASITDYVATLQGQGKPVTLLLDPDEGHNPRKPMFRQAYSHLLQRMLQEHLGGPAVPAPAPELARYLEQTVKVNGALKSL